MAADSPPHVPLPSFLQTLAFWRYPHGYLQWCQRTYGATFCITPVGKPPLVFMSQAARIKQIVTAPADVLLPGVGGEVLAPLVGEGSFMLADEDLHLIGRRRILPALHHQQVREHAQMVEDIVAREIAQWPADRPIALLPRLRALTLRVILKTIFKTDEPLVTTLHARLLALFSIADSLVLQEPRLRWVPGWRGLWRRFLAHRAEVDALIAALIAQEATSCHEGNELLANILDGSHDTANSATHEIRDTLMSMILAGHETTAAQLAWAFQLLAHNNHVAEGLRAELKTSDEKYLMAVIYEVLRHRPVFLFAIPRAVARPYAIAGCLYRPPVHLVGCIYLMHHDPQLYDRPDSFQPERFLATAPPRELWMPWGGGRKRCPGHHLAMLEMRTVLRTIYARYRVVPAVKEPETAHWRSVIVVPGQGCRVTLRRRTASPLAQHRVARTSLQEERSVLAGY